MCYSLKQLGIFLDDGNVFLYLSCLAFEILDLLVVILNLHEVLLLLLRTLLLRLRQLLDLVLSCF